MMIRRIAALTCSSLLVVAACGGSRDDEAADTTAAATTAAPVEEATTTAAATPDSAAPAETTVAETSAPTTEAPVGETFGDLAWPCGPAAEANTDDGSEVGVTAESITIGIGDDAGFATSPGLNHEMTDAMNALVAKCNELGGIHGRQITTNYYDAAIFDVATSMQAACDAGNFFLVGQGWAFDSSQEEIRLGCGLPSAPAYSVSAAFAHGKDMFQGLPNPSDETPAAHFFQIAEQFPEEVKAVGALVSNFAANTETRDKVLIASPSFGWNFVSSDLFYNPAGEADWTPFVRQLQDSGAKMVLWVGTCLPGLQQFAQTAKANGFDVPIVTDANHYASECAAANADGAMDNVYLRFAFTPFEEASSSKATQDYLELLDASGGDTALLGMHATSSFFLWATAASQCGATLTRQCTLDNLAAVTEWTAGGLHAATNPGANHPPSCGVLLKLEGTSYARVSPSEAAGFDCGDEFIAPIAGTTALDAALLDENRIAQQFSPAG